ncbi:MAG TPA: insulinase family protein [Calditrichia bacterium]|nr:insulinase family protein [Calditrichia bacterium]
MSPQRLFFLLMLMLVAACAGPKPQTASADSPNPGLSTLPVDSAITIGKLANGLTYYIRENHKPEGRAELRLAVNAGSILEGEDQLGLAHFVEHMAFNGTENFRKQELVNYLESVGMRFGPDLNAYTSFDETVYMLQIPTDSSEIVHQAFRILGDWAGAVSFDDEEIDKERGVVIEEWRSGRGASARMRDREFPVLFHNSRYAERLPIGKKETLENFPHEVLKRFYRDWYRPELMAVVAVGDFEGDSIKTIIEKTFGALPASPTPAERPLYEVPDHQEPLFSIISDPEARYNQISIYYKHQPPPQGRASDYRRGIVEGLVLAMLNARLDELTRQNEPPYLFAQAGSGAFIRTKSFFSLAAIVQESGRLVSGLEALLREAKRVEDYGFTESELARQKAEVLRYMENAYLERDKTESGRYAAEYIRNYLTDEPLPGIAREYRMYRDFLPEISLEEINVMALELIRPDNQVVLVSAPEQPGQTLPDQAELQAAISSVSQTALTAYQDQVSDQPLLPDEPAGGKIVSESRIADIDVTEWTLSNGVKVILKPTAFQNEQVLFSAYSPGGHSLVSDADYASASLADNLIAESGVGDFDPIALEKKLSGKILSLSPSIDTYSEGFSGSASPDDVETLLQLVYLYFTAPRADSLTYKSYRERILATLANRSADPNSVFGDSLNAVLTGRHPRHRPWSEERLEQLELQKALSVFQDRFADAGDFTFLFAGNIDMARYRELIPKYLGALPGLGRVEKGRDTGMRPPQGIIKKTVYKGLEAKSRVSIVMNGDFEWNRQNRYNLNSMVSVLRIMLREAIREDRGGTYGVGVGASPMRQPFPHYQVVISFGCDPERVDELLTAVYGEIEKLKTEGPSPENLAKVKETQRRQQETDLQENGYWLRTLRFYYQNGESPEQILELDRYIQSLTAAGVQAAAKQYLRTDNLVEMVLKPEVQAQ